MVNNKTKKEKLKWNNTQKNQPKTSKNQKLGLINYKKRMLTLLVYLNIHSTSKTKGTEDPAQTEPIEYNHIYSGGTNPTSQLNVACKLEYTYVTLNFITQVDKDGNFASFCIKGKTTSHSFLNDKYTIIDLDPVNGDCIKFKKTTPHTFIYIATFFIPFTRQDGVIDCFPSKALVYRKFTVEPNPSDCDSSIDIFKDYFWFKKLAKSRFSEDYDVEFVADKKVYMAGVRFLSLLFRNFDINKLDDKIIEVLVDMPFVTSYDAQVEVFYTQRYRNFVATNRRFFPGFLTSTANDLVYYERLVGRYPGFNLLPVGGENTNNKKFGAFTYTFGRITNMPSVFVSFLIYIPAVGKVIVDKHSFKIKFDIQEVNSARRDTPWNQQYEIDVSAKPKGSPSDPDVILINSKRVDARASDSTYLIGSTECSLEVLIDQSNRFKWLYIGYTTSIAIRELEFQGDSSRLKLKSTNALFSYIDMVKSHSSAISWIPGLFKDVLDFHNSQIPRFEAKVELSNPGSDQNLAGVRLSFFARGDGALPYQLFNSSGRIDDSRRRKCIVGAFIINRCILYADIDNLYDFGTPLSMYSGGILAYRDGRMLEGVCLKTYEVSHNCRWPIQTIFLDSLIEAQASLTFSCPLENSGTQPQRSEVT